MTDMQRPGPDDLLSAYFDHEVTSAERAAAEQWLEESPEARTELDEIGALSDLLRSLPRERAPDHLVQSTLQRAERETLLPKAAAAVAPVVAAARRQREWLVVLTGLATTAAAAVLIVTSLPNQHAPVGSVDFGVAALKPESRAKVMVGESAESNRLAPSPWADGRGVESLEVESLGTPREPMGRDSTSVHEAGVSLAARAQPSPAAAGSVVFDTPAPSPAPATQPSFPDLTDKLTDKERLGDSMDVLVTDNQPASALLPEQPQADWYYQPPENKLSIRNLVSLGQVFPYFVESREGKVAVVEFTVIDVNQAADNFEVLLIQNGGLPEAARAETADARSESSPAKSGADRAAEVQGQATSENLIAFYLQAEPQLVSQMVQKLQSEAWVTKVNLMPPVPQQELVADVDTVTAERVEDALLKNGIPYGNSAGQNESRRLMFRQAGGMAGGGASGKSEAGNESIGTLGTSVSPQSNFGVTENNLLLAENQYGSRQMLQRFALRPLAEVSNRSQQVDAKNLTQTKSVDATAMPELQQSLPLKTHYGPLLSSHNSMRMLFILQQDLGPQPAGPVKP